MKIDINLFYDRYSYFFLLCNLNNSKINSFFLINYLNFFSLYLMFNTIRYIKEIVYIHITHNQEISNHTPFYSTDYPI